MSKAQAEQTIGPKTPARRPDGAGLLLFDLDDTIVQAGSYVSPRVLGALAAARDAGFVLSVASGRAVCDIHPAIRRSAVMDYAVCANGAEVVRLADGCRIAGRAMPQEDAVDCYRLLEPYGPAWYAFFGGRSYFEWKGASYMLTGRSGALARAERNGTGPSGAVRRAAYIVRRGARFAWRMVSNPRHRQVRGIGRHLARAEAGVDKMGCTILDARLCAEAVGLLGSDGRFEVVRMGETELEVTAAGVTKGTGARALMDELGIGAAGAVAFGDGGNDLPLAAAVGRFVAMGNADAEVKDVADEVCPTVADDGVAVWIEAMLGRRLR